MSDFKAQVIQAAVQGMHEGGLIDPEAEKKFVELLELVYDCGYNECRRNDYERSRHSVQA